jgi:hypothetical protein
VTEDPITLAVTDGSAFPYASSRRQPDQAEFLDHHPCTRHERTAFQVIP